MDDSQKLALAAEIITAKFPWRRPGTEMAPETMKRMESAVAAHRAARAELYAKHFSMDQLQTLREVHAGAIAETMRAVEAELHRRQNEAAAQKPVGLMMAVNSAMPRNAGTHVIRDYVKAVEAGATGTALSRFYTPDALQIEHPNRLNPKGGQSDVATMLKRAEQGQKLLSGQRYEVLSLVAMDDIVAAEVLWTGTLAVPLGNLAAGAEMRAHLAMFFELKDGLIHRQRNYDCFE